MRGSDGDGGGRTLRADTVLDPARIVATSSARLLLGSSDLPLDRITRLTARAAAAPICALAIVDADSEHLVAAHGTALTTRPLPDSPCAVVVGSANPVVVDCPHVADTPRMADDRSATDGPVVVVEPFGLDDPLALGDPLGTDDPLGVVNSLEGADQLVTDRPAVDRPAVALQPGPTPARTTMRWHGLPAFVGHPVHLHRDVVGVLLVADTQLRDWTAAQLGAVEDAARLVTSLLTTEAQRHHTAARAAETDAMLAAAPHAVLGCDPDGTITRWSPGGESMFGWSAAEAIGRDLDDLIVAPRSREHCRQARLSATRSQPPRGQRITLWARYRDGHEFAVDGFLSAVESRDGRRLQALLHDASDRVRAELAAARHLHLPGVLLDTLDVPVIVGDPDGRPVLIGRALRALCGADDAAGEGCADGAGNGVATGDDWPAHLHLHHPDGRPLRATDSPLARAAGTGGIDRQRLLVHLPQGGQQEVTALAQPLRSTDGTPLGVLMTVRDAGSPAVIDRFAGCEVAVERILGADDPLPQVAPDVLREVSAAARARYAELWLAEQHPDRLSRISSHGVPPRGQGPRQSDGWYGDALAVTAWRQGQPASLSDTGVSPVTEGGAERSATTERGGDEPQAQACATAVPIRSGERILGVLTVVTDVPDVAPEMSTVLLLGVASHLAHFLERRRAARLALELARAKDEYIALVGHELRTPLTSVSAYTDLVLEDPRLDQENRWMLEVVQRNAATLRAIIGDLLDLAALDSGHIQVDLRRTDLRELVAEAVLAAEPLATAAQLTVDSELSDGLLVAADDLRLRQVVDNLLSNAIKYTPAGGTVTVRLSPTDNVATLSVSDTGPGIPPAERTQLFQRFFRGSAAKNRSIPGSGLGLAISRVIMDRHGGTIEVADQPDPGTTLVIRLPLLPDAD